MIDPVHEGMLMALVAFQGGIVAVFDAFHTVIAPGVTHIKLVVLIQDLRPAGCAVNVTSRARVA